MGFSQSCVPCTFAKSLPVALSEIDDSFWCKFHQKTPFFRWNICCESANWSKMSCERNLFDDLNAVAILKENLNKYDSVVIAVVNSLRPKYRSSLTTIFRDSWNHFFYWNADASRSTTHVVGLPHLQDWKNVGAPKQDLTEMLYFRPRTVGILGSQLKLPG